LLNPTPWKFQPGDPHNRKEVKTMKYEKPEVVVLDDAISAVQSTPKPSGGIDVLPSAPSYQSDEE
jgi:hypothetical protein